MGVLIVAAVVFVMVSGIWALVAFDRSRGLDKLMEWQDWGERAGLVCPQIPTGRSPWLGQTISPVPPELVRPLDSIPGLSSGTIEYFLSGLYRGHEVRTFHHSYIVHAGKTTVVITHHVFAVKVSAKIPWFGVRCHRLWDRIAKAFGYPDLELGDPDFDRRYYVFGNDAKDIAGCLTPVARRIIADSSLESWSRVGEWLVGVGTAVNPGSEVETRLAEVIALADALA